MNIWQQLSATTANRLSHETRILIRALYRSQHFHSLDSTTLFNITFHSNLRSAKYYLSVQFYNQIIPATASPELRPTNLISIDLDPVIV